MKEFLSVHHPNIWTVLKNITSMLLSIEMMVHFIRNINAIQCTKPLGRQCNWLLDTVVTIKKYKKITIDNEIYIKVFSGGTMSYLMVSNDGVLNTTNSKTYFP